MDTRRLLEDIKNLKIQGASQIGLTFLTSLKSLSPNLTREKVLKDILKLRTDILNLRPTEPLVFNFSQILINRLKKARPKDRYNLSREINRLSDAYKIAEENIVKTGVSLIKNKENIFTHCHSSLVENILVQAKKRGKSFHVFNSETRPLFQGRITAKNLISHRIKVTQVCDSAAAFLISDHSGDEIKIHKLILGADVIGLNGWAVNKIGSFGLALAAWESGIPVYIAVSLLKIDPQSQVKIRIPLEMRDSREIWPEAPKGLLLENFAFDCIPAKFITAFVTEFGLIKPKGIAKIAKKHYPDLF